MGNALGKKQKIIKACIISLITLLMLGGVVFFVFGVMLKDPVVPTYSFSGYVYADDEPLSGATVSCGAQIVTTDDQGFYSFEGLTKVVEVSVSKDGYLFDDQLVYVNSNKQDINFSGYQIFDMKGVVQSEGQVIPFAQIVATSEMGVYTTTANEFGEFYLPELAGKVDISAIRDDMKFFDQEFDKAKDNLIVSGTTDISGSIVVDYGQDFDFELSLDGSPVDIKSDNTFAINNVTPNSRLILSSQNYHIIDSEVVIDVENKNIVFSAQKIYDISGIARSGNVALSGIKLNVGGRVVYTDIDGGVSLNGLYGDITILAYSSNYLFDNVTINALSENFECIGTFGISGSVASDDGVVGGLTITNGTSCVTTNRKGEFVINRLQYGERLSVVADGYHIDNNNAVIAYGQKVVFNLHKIYALDLQVMYNDSLLDNVIAIVDGIEYTMPSGELTIDNLYGNHDIRFSLDGFRFDDSYQSSYLNTLITANPYKYFSLSGYVHSDDVIISDAKVIVNGLQVGTDELGMFSIDYLYTSGRFTVLHNKYNSVSYDYNLDNCDFDINLDYDISGTIMCDDSAIGGVTVSVGGQNVLSDDNGYFHLDNLSGNQVIELIKEYYNFEDIHVCGGGSLSIDCTYSISGYAYDNQTPIVGLKIVAVKNDGELLTLECLTNEMGYYSFDDLTGEYLLFFDSERQLDLLPNSYVVSSGGRFNFANVGYKFSGRVTSGNVGVVGVSVKAGDTVVSTDIDGYYSFELLLQDEVLVLEKPGYEFNQNNIPVNSAEFNKRTDVNFTCTYQVNGCIRSGTTALAGVTVSIADKHTVTDNQGCYYISGLSGKNNITITLEGFSFSGISSVSCASEINYSATLTANIVVKTGDVNVGGVIISIEDREYTSNSSGVIAIPSIKLGDRLSASKNGYEFNDITIAEYQSNYVIEGSYSISGTVAVGGNLLKDAVVSCAGQTYTTLDNGQYYFSGLKGSVVVSITHQEFDFDDIAVTGNRVLNILAKYSVSGVVSVAGKPIENVRVNTSSQEVYTDNNGQFRIDNLQTEEELLFYKQGYLFDGEYVVLGACNLQVIALYSISGIVKSGDLIVSNATVMLSNGMSTTSDDNGVFELSGILEKVDITIVKTNYNNCTISDISDYSCDIVANLEYNVTFNLSGLVDYNDVIINVNGVTNTYSGEKIIVYNLSGKNLISLSKGDYIFSPMQIEVIESREVNVVAKLKYSITGRATTEEGIAVSNAVVTAGMQSAITDNNGNYRIDNLIDSNKVVLKLSAGDYSYEQNIDQVTGAKVVNPIINNYNYAFFMFKRGYHLLDTANSYQISGTGNVKVNVKVIVNIEKNQEVTVKYKKDALGNRLIENLNYGTEVAGVDPRVSLLTYVNLNDKSIKYQKVNGDSISADHVATYSDTWTDVADSSKSDYDAYLSTMGTSAEGYYPYVINNNTVESISTIVQDSSGSSFTIKLKTTEEMYYYYKIQMGVMCSDQSLNSFEYVNLAYTFDNNGYIKTLGISEKYYVTAMGQTATCVGTINYTFHTFSQNEVIPNFDISNNSTIQTSLAIVTPTTISTLIDTIDVIYVDSKRRVIV